MKRRDVLAGAGALALSGCAAEQQCDDLGIKEKVVFLGNSTEIDRILCFSDLFPDP